MKRNLQQNANICYVIDAFVLGGLTSTCPVQGTFGVQTGTNTKLKL